MRIFNFIAGLRIVPPLGRDLDGGVLGREAIDLEGAEGAQMAVFQREAVGRKEAGKPE